MYGNVRSASVYGIEAMLINVEADVSDGLPLFNMVGYLASEVKEAKDRVRTALKNSNFALRPKHITINLSPSTVKFHFISPLINYVVNRHVFVKISKSSLIMGYTIY